MQRMNIRTTVSGLAALGLLLVCGCDFPAVLMLLAAWGMHEYAHLLTSEVLGYSKGELQLTSFGGRLNLDPLSDINAEAEYLIAVSGPLANWLMVLGVWYLKWLGVEHAYLAYWQKINCLLGTLNLIPAWPLDGGRLVHAWLNRHFGMERAVLVSRVLAGAVAIFSFGCGAVLLVNQRGGSLFIIVGGFIAAHWIQIKNPPFVLSWKLLQHKASRLKARGLLEARLVMVNPGTLLREALQAYGNNDYLLFCFFGPGQELWMVSEDLAWKALVAHGFNTTFLETMKAGFTVNLQKLPR